MMQGSRYIALIVMLTAFGIAGSKSLLAQEIIASDSLTLPKADSIHASLDSIRPGYDSLSLSSDTMLVWETVNSSDTIVNYKAADSIVYDMKAKNMKMFKESDIDYGSFAIVAERITIDWEAGTMAGLGVPDTSAGAEGKLIGTPVFREGSEEYRGLEMTYNFKTKRGVIQEGRTSIDDGFYIGDKIKRMSNDVYFIQDGKYTTCDLEEDHKHFHFGSPRMKVVPNDVIVAEPVTFYVEEIPLFWIPFAVIPSSSGRRSGVIVPSFGDDYARGRYLKNGGYYLAMSDYWDMSLTGDWYWKGGYKLNTNIRYALRYNFTGSIDASFGRQTFQIGNPYQPDDLPQTDYSMTLRHNQTINPTSQLNVDFNFISNGFYNKYSTDINQLISQTADSRATYSTRWEGTNRSLTVAIARSQNLQTNASNTTLPDISFNQSQIFPFRAKGSLGNEWYEQIGFNYSARALNKIDVIEQFEDTNKVLNSYDRKGVSHSVSFILNPKFGHVTVSPSLSYRERWYDHRLERYYDPLESADRAHDRTGFFAIRTFDASINLSTKLYGLFRPDVFGIQGIRHTVQPSLGYSYNPDFSKSSWGYYQSYQDSLDNEIRYDPYSGFDGKPGEAFGGVGMGESQRITMGLSNLFEMKLDPAADDTTGEAERVKLLNLNANSSYNLAADSLNLAPINLSFNTSIGTLLDISGNASFDPYVYRKRKVVYNASNEIVRTIAGGRINKYMLDEGQGLVRMTSFGINLRSSLSSDMFMAEPEPEDTSAEFSLTDSQMEEYDFTMKWRLGIGYSYSITQQDPDNKFRRSSIDATLNFDLTPKWQISASTYYDLVNKQIGTPRINITRDLHCWEMAFSWVPAGPYRQYNFVIRIKAPQLQDLKLERQGSDRGVY
jgi:lipopolysaccharide assembly outer membrane protein LptD (OstA)